MSFNQYSSPSSKIHRKERSRNGAPGGRAGDLVEDGAGGESGAAGIVCIEQTTSDTSTGTSIAWLPRRLHGENMLCSRSIWRSTLLPGKYAAPDLPGDNNDRGELQHRGESQHEIDDVVAMAGAVEWFNDDSQQQSSVE
jgi:hypothetical protein